MKAKELESGNPRRHYVVSIDMGSPKHNHFAWCDNGENREGSLDIDKLILALSSKTYFAMGIEAPLFIPLRPDDLKRFTGEREGIDGNHPWSAGAGAAVTAIDLDFLGSLLTRIYRTHPAGWSREAADGLFLNVLLEDCVPKSSAYLAYWGVRLFGESAWKAGGK